MDEERPRPVNLALHRFACLTAAATLVLVFAGALVTSTGSALSVPDWPLSYGSLMPPMVGGVIFEHSHRLIAGTVAILTLTLAIWLARREPRPWVRRLGFVALGAVVLQALLGGITVLLLLPTPISVAHACLGQTFLCLVVTLALVTSPRWPARSVLQDLVHPPHGATDDPSVSDHARADARVPGSPAVRDRFSEHPASSDRRLTARLAVVTFAAVYVQLILGAVMRHTGSGLAIPDFPLAFGHLLPPVWSSHVAIHFAHRVWALVVTAFVVASVTTILKSPSLRLSLWRPALLLSVLIPVQIALGAVTVLSMKQALATSAHVATGALILITTLVLAIRAVREMSYEAEVATVTGEATGAPIMDIPQTSTALAGIPSGSQSTSVHS